MLDSIKAISSKDISVNLSKSMTAEMDESHEVAISEENYDADELTLLDLFYDDDFETLIDRLKNEKIENKDLLNTDEEGLNILTAAVVYGKTQIVELVLDKLDYKSLPNYSSEPIYYAVLYTQLEIIKILLDRITEIDLAKTDEDGMTLLHAAAGEEEASEILEILLNRGAQVDTKNNDGKTPLHTAAACGNFLGVKLLLKRGAFVNQPDNNGDTPMHDVASKCDNIDNALMIFDLLVMASADLNIKNKDGQDVLEVCCAEELRSCIEKDIQYRADFPLHTIARLDDEKPLLQWIHQANVGELFTGIKWYGKFQQGTDCSENYFFATLYATPAEKKFIKFRLFGSGSDEDGPFIVSGTWSATDVIQITLSYISGYDHTVDGKFDSATHLMVGTFVYGENGMGKFEFDIPLWPCVNCSEMIPIENALCLNCAPESLNEEITEEWIEEKQIKFKESLKYVDEEINKPDDHDRTAIMCAAIHVRPKILSILLPFVEQESLKNIDDTYKTALDHVVGRKLVCGGGIEEDFNNDILECIEILRKGYHIEINLSTIPEMTYPEKKHQFCHGDCQTSKKSLTYFAEKNDWVSIQVSLDSDQSDNTINELDENGKSILHYICENGKVRLFKLLSGKKNFYRDLLTKNNAYPLYLAAYKQKIDMINALLDAGADPSKLISPAHGNYFRVGKKQFILLEGEALRVLKDKVELMKNYPSYYIARVKNLAEAEKLKNDKESALHVAVRNKLPLDVLRKLIDENLFDIDDANKDEETPLIIAARMGSLDHVICLLLNYAAVDCKNKEGKTSLMCAAIAGHIDVVKALLDGLADIDVEDHNGKTVLNLLDECIAKHVNGKNDKEAAKRNEIKEMIVQEDLKRETSVEYRKNLTSSLIDVEVVDAFEGNSFAKAINCSPVLGRSFLNDCVLMDRHQLTFKHLDVVYGARVKGSALYSILNMKTDDEDLIFEAKKECLEHVVIRRIMEIKWELFGQRKYIESLLVYVLLLSTMTISSILFKDKVAQTKKNTLDFAVVFGTIVMIFTLTSFIVVQCLRPRILWHLARYGYDGSIAFEPKKIIPDLPSYKKRAKNRLLLLTIFLTIGFSTLAWEAIAHFNFDQYFMEFNNVVLALSSLYFILTEVHELVASGWDYFNDIINCTQSLMYVLILGFFVPMKMGLYGPSDLSIQVVSGGFITIFLWILFLQFLEVVPNASYLLPMISKLMRDVWNFFLFLAVFQVGITITYYQIFVNKDDDAFSSLSQSFYTTYFVLFGNFPTDSLDAFSNFVNEEDRSLTGEHFLYVFTVILMMFHAAAVTIILMNLLMASMNKTVDGGLERARTEALASYANAILRLEISNYSEEENIKLMYLVDDEKVQVLNPIFTQPIHKAKLNITPEQEEMIQKHLDSAASREQKTEVLKVQVLEAFDLINDGLKHIGHFTKIPIQDVLGVELYTVQEYRKALEEIFIQMKKCRDQLPILPTYKKIIKKLFMDLSKELHDYWEPENDTQDHARCVMLYQIVHKRTIYDTILSTHDIISNYFDAAILEATLEKKEEPKTSELLSLLEGMNKKNQEIQAKLDDIDKKYKDSQQEMMITQQQLLSKIEQLMTKLDDKKDSEE
ncbi:hypothetical protein THRCLA_03771 [Thraustotheca clavata]|uniref:Ion transport domain-containing protein n=1 Tax=Thraustotheca clavata TaxID=74557 RepID=A0A1W0A100_9STRA|nr:hypothetical protein THRCLA_03771 [Thraustotheca clavata]